MKDLHCNEVIMKNKNLSQKIITIINSWEGFEDFDGTDIEFCSKNKAAFVGLTPTVLMIAVERYDIDVVKSLIQAGANVNYIQKDEEFDDEFFNTPLKDACMHGRYELVKTLLKAGADVNLAWKNGLAAIGMVDDDSIDYTNILKVLIKAGADVNNYGGHALQRAIGESKLEEIKILVNARAKIDIPSADIPCHKGRTAFMSFLDGKAVDLEEDEEEELFLLFYKNIGNVNVQDNDGKSLIFYALNTYIGGDDFNLIVLDRILFNENIDINLTDKNQNTALNTLLLAIEEEGYTTDELDDDERCKIESFLIAGSNVEIRNADGDSPKIMAKRIGNEDIQSLIENGDDLINTENRMGKTPLFIASLQGHTEKVKWLIKKGAYVNTKNKCHKIPRRMEMYGTVVPMYEETIKPKFYTALMAAQNIKTAKALILAGSDINEQASDGNTALMLYTKDNWLEGVEELISAGADANLTNKWFETALTIAKKNSKSKTMHYKQPEKLINFLQKYTARKFIPSILSTLFCTFKSGY